MSVFVLISTIPARKAFAERLLRELTAQRRQPDSVILVLDGYGAAPAPLVGSLPVVCEHRTEKLSGAGQRWLKLHDLDPDDIVINLDDDIILAHAPNLIRALVDVVERTGGAAAAMGRTADGKPALPSPHSRGPLIYAAGCGLALRAKHLDGLQTFADEIKANGGPDALGVGGDDDALVSAFLWKRSVVITHAATGNIVQHPGAKASSQTVAKAKTKERPDAQKNALKKATGWPWPIV